MRVKILIKSLVITLSVGIAVGLISVYPLLTVACAAAPRAPLALPVTRSATALPVQASDAIVEWNQQAVALSLRPVPALSPVQQTRVMAIFQ